jgi:hypothetical protein
MTELFLYDREKGLFKEILKKSTVIKGHYHVSPNFGKDLDTNNLETFIKDPKNGLTDVPEKYPLCVCMTPVSKEIKINGQDLEQFIFNLYFVTTTFYTSDNKIKSLDKDTNTSAHHIWYDWQDMKTCASNFIKTLKKVVAKRTIMLEDATIPYTVPLKTVVNLDGDVIYKRLTKFNNDRLSGVSLSFAVYMDNSQCTLDDYANVDVKDIIIPPLDIHPLHTQ